VKQGRIIFLYDYFYPDFTAGGPITALGNLCRLVNESLDIQIVTSCYEYKSNKVLGSVAPNTWLAWGETPVYYASSVWYASRAILTMEKCPETTLYLNGVFSWRYFLVPLLCAWVKGFKVIISPRGMLQTGALKSHAFKKKIYLALLRASGLLHKSTWHATDEQERLDILNRITARTIVVVVPDVPLISTQQVQPLSKETGSLHLLYFSLIAEKKNLLFALELLNSPELQGASLDIIGPIKDKYYWEKCLNYIRGMNNSERIKYKGEIHPSQVEEILSGYHALILTTQGENFGHVIIEMLSCGRPVFISDKTPWQDLNQQQVGCALPLNATLWKQKLVEAMNWSQGAFDLICLRSRRYYENAFDFDQIKEMYIRMFVPLPLHDHSVVLTYDYFYPDFSAGGPIASLGNLTRLLKNEMPLRILTSSYHYKKGQFMEGIALDQWTVWKGFPVWYASNAWSIIQTVLGFKKGGRTIFYLNGIFSVRYFLIPLMLCVWKGYRIIVSPRGMLQEGAMKKGYAKKQLYISLIKRSQLLSKVVWHATDVQESEDIRLRIGQKARVYVISNVPMKPVENAQVIQKAPGQLHLVYYSLVSEKKNLDFFLQLMEHPSLYTVRLDIIGPIKDSSYWRKCQRTIGQMKHPERIRYLGELSPDKSMEALQQYHGLVLPTLGENFGHAIVEMLSVSRPVIISDKTPWNDLSVMKGGFALPLEQEKWIAALEVMLNWGDQDFKKVADGALLYYQDNFDFAKLKKDYIEMFSNVAS
jgi:glycosyltransferase involved in cell wall biosynthesis